MKVAWGITGSGDLIDETVELMTQMKERHNIQFDIFVSKAGRQVLNWYKLWGLLNEQFKVKTEADANVPFIAGPLQMGKWDLLVVAPLTANSTAKIAHGIEDSLLTNAVAQCCKGSTPVILLPVDQEPGEIETIIPDGRRIKLRTRRVDIENVERLRKMEGITVVSSLEQIAEKISSMLNE
ncbi:MAG: archaeoflavoprotein AfpA [Candidatus Thorarchaeota archaeon]|nr:archaeoflavoprotein AfpA [Candidatus Thorarchaeota archaeon]